MAERFQIYDLPLLAGRIALSPIPGRGGDYAGDLQGIARWRPNMVITMTETAELRNAGAQTLPDDLDCAWRHLPVQDFGVPGPEVDAAWPDVSSQARQILSNAGRVLVHCYGGQGRSGMAVLRIMIDAGVGPAAALTTLRQARPKAVETEAQMRWAWGTELGKKE